MKIAKQSRARHTVDDASTPALNSKEPSNAIQSAPAIVASAFVKLDPKGRASLLGRLLGSVGPLALAVIGGGVFAKFLPDARMPAIQLSFEDGVLATSSQVYELARYVEQSNPDLIEGLVTTLLQDGMVMTALGASLVAIAIKRFSDRRGTVVRPRITG